MKLSVFIVTNRRAQLFQQCYESVCFALQHISEPVEVLVALNGPQAEVESYLAQRKRPHTRILRFVETARSQLRNVGIEEARGEILYFLDDDVLVPEDLFEKALFIFTRRPDVAVLGGPNLTPDDSSLNEKVFGAVLTSPAAAPVVWRRYSTEQKFALARASELSLILCNLALRRSALPPDLRFKAVTSNEENLFINACEEAKLGVFMASSLYVFHRRRSNFVDFMRQIYSYGQGRGEQLALAPLGSSTLFWVLFFSPAWLLYLSPQWKLALGCYFGMALWGSLQSRTIRVLKAEGVIKTLLLHPVVHASYLAGIWVGFVRHFVRLAAPVAPPEVQPL